MKKTLVASSLILVLAAVSALAQDAKPNFSGTWNMDLSKSDFGPVPAPDSLVAVIEHKEPSVKITTTQKGQQGEIVNERILTTDGKENTNKMRMMGGEQEIKSTSKWNGKKLTTAFKLDVQGAPVEFNDAWELSDDGKVMTIVRDIKTPQGDFTTKTVFSKQ